MLRFIKGSIIILILFEVFQIIDYKVHNYIIDNIYLNSDVTNKVNYIGYIEIERLNIKREIVLGINNYNLLQHVALSKESKNLDNDTIVLAGHAIKNIFGNLKNIKENDIIKIKSINKTYYYKVIDIKIIFKDKRISYDSNLTLITCFDYNKRLIVSAKRV